MVNSGIITTKLFFSELLYIYKKASDIQIHRFEGFFL